MVKNRNEVASSAPNEEKVSACIQSSILIITLSNELEIEWLLILWKAKRNVTTFMFITFPEIDESRVIIKRRDQLDLVQLGSTQVKSSWSDH